MNIAYQVKSRIGYLKSQLININYKLYTLPKKDKIELFLSCLIAGLSLTLVNEYLVPYIVYEEYVTYIQDVVSFILIISFFKVVENKINEN